MPAGGGWVASATAYDGLIYVFGGSNYSPWSALNTVYVYEPKADTWTKKKDMPTPRFALQSYLVDGRIYVIGGSQTQGTSVATVEVYDPVNDTWEALADMPQNLLAFAGASAHGRLYIIGGTSNWFTNDGGVEEYDPLGLTTGVERQRETVPNGFELEQNYPNPFNPTTAIRYQVSGYRWVHLAVFDVLGREVAVLVNERKAPGQYEVRFDASGLASGVYFYRLQAGDFAQARKLVVLK
jgi:hypothetical protein